MNKLEQFLAKWLINKLMDDGRPALVQLFGMIRDEGDRRWYEDNEASRTEYLAELLAQAQYSRNVYTNKLK
jgi:hypothetical protein